MIVDENKSYLTDIEKGYGLSKNEVLFGVGCLKCDKYGMVRVNVF